MRQLALAPAVKSRARVTTQVVDGAAQVAGSFGGGCVFLVARLFGAHVVAVQAAKQGALLSTRVGLNSAMYVRIPTRISVVLIISIIS